MQFKYTLLTIIVTAFSILSLKAQFPCNLGNNIVSAAGQGSSVSLCDPGSSSILSFNNNIEALPHGFVVTNENDEIVFIGLSSNIDFSAFTGNSFNVYSFTFIGSITASVGQTLTGTPLANGCFNLSTNSITVNTSGGEGAILEGGPFTFCVGDGEPDMIAPGSISVTGNPTGANASWVITDDQLNILGLPPMPSVVDFDVAGGGECLIWYLTYDDLPEGLEAGMNAADLEGCFALSNSISVFRNQPDGGIIYTSTDEVANRVVVANRASGSISVIDSDQNAVLGNYDMPDNGEPMYAVYNSSNQTVLVGDYNGKVVAFDAITFEVTGTAEAGAGVFHMWGSPDNQQLWVNNELDRTISVINPTTLENIATVSLPTDLFDAGYKPHDVIVMPNNQAAFVTLIGTTDIDYVIKYDASTFMETARAEVGRDPHVSLTSANDKLYVASQGSSELKVLNRSDLSEVTTLNIPNAHGLGMNSDGTYLYIGNIAQGGTNATYTLDLETNTLVGDPVDSPVSVPHNYAVSGNGQLYLTHSGMTNFQVSIYDLSPQPSLINTVNTGMNPFGLVAYSVATTTTIEICAGDGMSDSFDVTLENATGTNSQWVITDDNLEILALPAGPPFDLEGAGPGTCLIWHLSYEDGLQGAEVGLNAGDLVGCYSLSNPITVVRNQPEGGTLTGGPFTFCVGDDEADMLDPGAITLDGNSGTNSQWVVTDEGLMILGLPSDPSEVNFDGAGAGTCLIWHLSYEDGLQGAEVGLNAGDLVGCYSLSNPVTVIRNQPDGGTLTGGPFTFTVGDGIADNIPAGAITTTNTNGTDFQWVVTDDEGYILGLPPSPDVVNFDGAGPGTCLVWYLAYEGTIDGLAAGMNANDLEGCFDLSNPIEVIRTTADGCPANGGDLFGGPFSFTVGDGVADNIPVGAITAANTNGTNFQWVVTDDEGYILGLPPSPDVVNFDGAGPGTCLVWYLAYEGTIDGLAAGMNANDLEGCFDLSNPIEVIRTSADGCPANGGDLFGGPFTFTVGDGIADNIPAGAITTTNTNGTNFQWVVTDDEGYILGLPPSPDVVNFDGAGPGTCLVWYLAYEGTIDGLAAGMNANDLEGCFDLSNPIEVIRTTADGCPANGGDLFGGPFSFTVGDGVADNIPVGAITATNTNGTNFQWVVTDDEGYILGLPPSPDVVNFDGAGPGTCLVWYLAYEGTIDGLAAGMNANDLEGCFDLSNPIEVIRTSADGCPANGGDLFGGPFSFTVGDGVADNIPVGAITAANTNGTNFQWVVTDDEGYILGLPPSPDVVNFDGAGPGTCLVWYLAYEGTIDGLAAGMNANDLEGCFDLSNPIEVIRTTADGCPANGGSLFGGPFTFCVNDGEPDMIPDGAITVANTNGTNAQWVVTDENLTILGLPGSISDVDFDAAGPGTCLIWYLSYEDGLEGAEVDLNAADLEGCFSLSNSIAVIREVVDGGTVTTEDGETEVTVIVGDGNADLISFDSTGVSDHLFTYVVTDDNNVILAVPGGDEVDFEDAPEGICRVWGLSYTGNIIAQAGDNAAEVALTDECFDLSDNFVNVIRTESLVGGNPGNQVVSQRHEVLGMSVWPNPVSELLNIQVTPQEQISVEQATISIVNVNGQLVQQRRLDDAVDQLQFDLDVSQLAPGVYNIIYEALGNDKQNNKVNNRSTTRFIKQ